MGQFSWIYADNKKQMIDNRRADSYLLVPPAFQDKYGKFIYEGCYDGYGRMGGHDVYELVAEWNREFLSPDMLRPAPLLEEYGGLDKWDRKDLVERGFSEEEINKIDKEKQKEYFNRAMRAYNRDIQMLSDYKTGREDKAMARDYGKDWKRDIGIWIACYDEQNAYLPYPIKITSKPMEYDAVGPSKRDPNQGWAMTKEENMEFVMELVRENGLELENVEDQTPEICLEAVKQNRMALCYIKDPQEFLSQLPKDDRLFIAKEVKEATASLIANGCPTQPLDGLANVLSQDASFEVRRAMIERNAQVDIHQSHEKSNERFMKKFGKDVDM